MQRLTFYDRITSDMNTQNPNISKKTENRKTLHRHIKVSPKAYTRLSRLSKEHKYRSRGIVGVVDDLIFGEFTTVGSGGTNNLHPFSVNKKSSSK